MKNAITLILLFACSQLHATEITIPEALKQNLISLTVTGIDYKSDSVYVSSFYGPCINLRVKNISKTLVNLYEAPGRLLMPDDTDQQTIMMSEVIAITLQPGQEVKRGFAVFVLKHTMVHQTLIHNFLLGQWQVRIF